MWKLSCYVLCTISIVCFSQEKLGGVSLAFADPPPSSGDVITRCENLSQGPTLEYGQKDPCALPWSEKLHEQYRSEDETGPWDFFQWGPQEPSKSDLSLMYRPGERRPLWGY